jgi:hypothetical protein
MRGLMRFLFQVALVGAVIFFGYHYFTKPNLRSCVEQPISDLSNWQKENGLTFNGQEVKDILLGIKANVTTVASKSGEFLQNTGELVKKEEGSANDKVSTAIVTEAQYQYCKSVVEKYEEKAR